MRFLIAPILCLLLAGNLSAQGTRDYAIDLKAEVSPVVPHLTLTWTLRQPASITAQVVHRRLKGSPTWVQQATLGTATTSYADNTAQPGVEYEYWMQRTYTGLSPNTAVGYITAGVHLPMVEHRGKLLLVVDQTMVAPLAPEIAQLRNDLTGDGWTVQTIEAARRDTLTDVTAAADTRALIKAAYDADPENVKQVYLLGHVPVPYAGNSAWDGHGNHSGAWSADGYYGDLDGAWTDSTVNNSTPTSVRLTNVPGDGRLDQSTIPSPLELMVGRVDLVNMQRAPAANVSEIALLRRYLRKAHDFKHKQGAYANVQRRVLIRDGFGTFGSEGFMRTGWAWGFTGVGRPPEVTFDEAPSGNWWTLAATNTYLMANGNGGGSYETCGSVGATADFGRRPFKAAFVSLFGSYFGDWDVTNNFMRAPLAGNATGDGLGLCSFWAGRPSFFMHHMATGETLGFSMRQSMNSQFTSVSSPVYSPVNFGGGGTHCGLLGDPSLRMHVVEPPRHLAATSANGQVNLGWAASTEPGLLGYHVYRAATPAGPFTRLSPITPLATPGYVDGTGTTGTPYTYLVRTLKLETAPGGTYENLSLGVMATLTVHAGATGAPLNPTGLTVVQASAASAQLSWLDNATDESGYRVERKVNGTGAYTPLISLPAGATSFTDPGPFTAGNTYFYQVIATGAAGDSIPSGEVSFEAVAGFFEFDNTLARTSKTVGTASIPVKRFGGVTGAVSVNFATANSSALAGTHYSTTSGTLNWADGETGPKNIDVPITNNGFAQQARQFRLTLSSPSAGTGIGTYNSVAVLIEDPTATLPAPWAQTLLGAPNDSSPAVDAEGGISSTTVGGSGLVTAATTEVGQFIYQPRTGDGVLTALVPAASPAQSGARYAVMIRENATSGGALMAGTFTSSNATIGSKFVYRTTVSATATITGTALSALTPQWLRITRAGNSFTSECSANGTTWISLGSVTVPMNATAQWGLFHHSDAPSTTTYSGNFQTASFQNITFGAVSVPDPPGNFAFTQPVASRVTLTWTAAVSAAGYRIERRSENGTFAQIVDLDGGALTFNDDAVAPNAGYEYRIYAFNSSGNSALSPILRVTTSPPDLTASITTESTAQSGDASVRASNTTGNFGSEPVLTLNGLSSTGALTPCSKIYLRFDLTGIPTTLKTATLRLAVAETRQLAQVGYSFSSLLYFFPETSDAWDEATITWANAPLNQTTGTSFTGAVFVGSLGFSNPLTIPTAGVVLGIEADENTINTQRGANDLVTLGMVTSTKAAIDFASGEHPTLPPPTLALTYASPLPTRPSFLTATPTVGTSIDLAWTENSSGETGFQIERRPAGGAFAVLQTLPPDTVAFNDATTTLGVTYEYRVRATSAAGDSAWSLVATAIAGGGTSLPGERMTFQNWLLDRNLAADADPAGDGDRDGLADLLQYALGLSGDPASSVGTPTPGQITIGNDRFLTVTFARRLDAIDVALSVEASDSVDGPWIGIDPLQPENQVSVEHHFPFTGWQTLTIKDSTPMTPPGHRFLRLRATVQ